MVTQVGGHTVELYDSIDMLPVARFHKYQKLLLIDAGVGSDIAGFDQRTERIRRYMMDGKADKALMELDNLRQCVYMVQTELSPKNRAFAALVTKVDGEACDDLSDEALQRVTDLLGDVPQSEMTALLGAVKKKNRR